MSVIWEVSLPEFIFVTLILGGGAAWLTSRAVALQWHSPLKAALWMILLTGAVRFIHFALFSGTLLSIQFYLVDLAILIIIALIAHRYTRSRQMWRRYPWLYTTAGPFSWRRKSARPGDDATAS
jgi:hypothetical protein